MPDSEQLFPWVWFAAEFLRQSRPRSLPVWFRIFSKSVFVKPLESGGGTAAMLGPIRTKVADEK
jgi:hypothetical protein